MRRHSIRRPRLRGACGSLLSRHPVLRRVLWRRSRPWIPTASAATPEDSPKQPTFTKPFDNAPASPDPEPPSLDPFSSAPPLPRTLPFSGAGRGAPRSQQPAPDNRFIRRSEAAKQAARRGRAALGSQRAATEVVATGSRETFHG
uniref:Uncharacterized protein n=1 Tax=Zea mays TaxID=4577 RepID=A0A804P7C5_MAIZE